jgi:hypothetical protein
MVDERASNVPKITHAASTTQQEAGDLPRVDAAIVHLSNPIWIDAGQLAIRFRRR